MKDARNDGFDCRAMVRKNGTVAELTKVKAGKKNGTGHVSTEVVVIETKKFTDHLDECQRLREIVLLATGILESLGSPFGKDSHQKRMATPHTGSSTDKWKKAVAIVTERIREMQQEFSRTESHNRMMENAVQTNGMAKSITDVMRTLELLIGTHHQVREGVSIEQASSEKKTRIVIEIPEHSHNH